MVGSVVAMSQEPTIEVRGQAENELERYFLMLTYSQALVCVSLLMQGDDDSRLRLGLAL